MTSNPSEPTEVNPSEETASHTEKRIMEAFAGMMLSCDRIRDTVRTTREKVNKETTNL